jgi:hypothetical protein
MRVNFFLHQAPYCNGQIGEMSESSILAPPDPSSALPPPAGNAHPRRIAIRTMIARASPRVSVNWRSERNLRKEQEIQHFFSQKFMGSTCLEELRWMRRT